MKRERVGLAGGSGQALEDGAKVESSIEQIPNLAEISMRVLVESEGVVRAGQCGLEVAQGCVDGQEEWVLGDGGTATGDVLLVQDAANYRPTKIYVCSIPRTRHTARASSRCE